MQTAPFYVAEPQIIPGFTWTPWRVIAGEHSEVVHSDGYMEREHAEAVARDASADAAGPLYVRSFNTGRLGKLVAVHKDMTGLGAEFSLLEYEARDGKRGKIRAEFAGVSTAGGSWAPTRLVDRYLAGTAA